ncbi:hypothetical protein JTB14_015911 [Gonioctena quinquepunctata]|nr:hypothetical protein JTB14_015911 [Gonioctena quinquepunctata]
MSLITLKGIQSDHTMKKYRPDIIHRNLVERLAVEGLTHILPSNIQKRVITRELLNEVRAAADVAIKQLCQQESFIKSLVDSISNGIKKILTKKFGILEAEMVKLRTDVQVIEDDHKKDVKTITDKIDTLGKKVMEFPGNSRNTIDIMKEINDMRQRENNVLFFWYSGRCEQLGKTLCEMQ